ncbi:MAG: hypothetical protein AB1416_10035, partial [Actinomycetota bacterium]
APRTLTPALTVPQSTSRIREDVARITLACGGDAACVGRVLLASRPAATQTQAAARGRRAPRTARVVFGSAKVNLKAGKRGGVAIRLNAAGRAAVRRKARVTAWVIASFPGSGERTLRAITLVR